MNDSLIWAEIDLQAIAHNVRELRRITRPEAALMVAVKANAYGHGAVEVARTALQNGAAGLGVARIEEGLDLRRAGIRAPILVFGYTPASKADQLLNHDLTATVYTVHHAAQLAEAAAARQRTIDIHIKVDTGMGRLGVQHQELRLQNPEGATAEILQIARMQGLALKGIFTHFATSDATDKTFAQRQFHRFSQLLCRLEAAGLPRPVRHAANSGAIIDMPETHLDMVRAGISVYGLAPSPEVDCSRIDLHPALTLKARIVHIKTVPAGTPISYGCTYVTPAATKIATVPVGYGDGYSRLLSNKGSMLAGRKRAPITGRVCMDLTMIDIGSDSEAKVGDEVVLISRQGTEMITADEIASLLNTINYEIVTTVMARVPRIFLN